MDDSPKERFLGICRFERPHDLCMLTTNGNMFWPKTLVEWVKQGAPEQILDARFRGDYFGFQHVRPLVEIRSGYFGVRVRAHTDIGHGIVLDEGMVPAVPAHTPRVVSEDERTITYVNGDGQTLRSLIHDPEQMPMYLAWPVKDRPTWAEYKKRLDPNTPERWPADWDTYVERMNSRSEPLFLEVGGFYGYLREMVGTEAILYMFYDDPGLVEDMMDTMLYLEIEVIKRTLRDIRVEQACFWEDMAYRSGPLISPDMVRRFMAPRYKKITDLLHSFGVDIIFIDSDGNVEQLIPIWIECGINFVWPFEVAAGNDAVAMRKKYGNNLIIGGAIDKRELLKGKEAIRDEVLSKVPYLLEKGGYFPSVDHLVPPDITFSNYCEFINTTREVAGLERLPFQ